MRNLKILISEHRTYGLMLGISLFNPLNYIPEHRVTLTSPAMVPTIYKNQAVWFNVIPEKWGKIELGTIIWFETPKSQGRSLISRVVGLPGDAVEMKSGLVYINGKNVDNPKTLEILRATGCIDENLELNNVALWGNDGGKNLFKIIVPIGSFYAVSDNRAALFMDSRYLGAIKLSYIKGVTHLEPQTQKLTHKDCIFDP